LEKNWEEIDKKLQIIKSFSRSVHIDIIDGKFADNLTFLDPAPFAKYKDDLFMEVHLMVENPLNYLQPFAAAGFKRFLGHIEKMQDISEFVAQGQILGDVGIAIDNTTPIDALKIPFDDLDEILLMSIHAGKSGQEFLPEVLEKIKAIRQQSQVSIEIDGGINDQTIIEAKTAGANRFVATSYIFNSKDPMQSFERLTSLA
jgi:ribulose-phosphate 3-epimerase